MFEENKLCNDPEHKNHMCSMKSQGISTNMDHIIGNESVECGICGAKASSVEYVCTPAKIYENEQVS